MTPVGRVSRGYGCGWAALEPVQPVIECHPSMISQLGPGIIFLQPSEPRNKANSCLWPGGSHTEQSLILQASEHAACNPLVAHEVNTDVLLPLPTLLTLCAPRASCPDRCSEFHYMALPPAVNHLHSLRYRGWPIACLGTPAWLQSGQSSKLLCSLGSELRFLQGGLCPLQVCPRLVALGP